MSTESKLFDVYKELIIQSLIKETLELVGRNELSYQDFLSFETIINKVKTNV